MFAPQPTSYETLMNYIDQQQCPVRFKDTASWHVVRAHEFCKSRELEEQNTQYITVHPANNVKKK